MPNPSPSLIEAELEVSGNQVVRIWVGGIGKVMSVAGADEADAGELVQEH